MDGDALEAECSDTGSSLVKVLGLLESTLGYQYHSSWSLSLQVFATVFEVVGMHCTSLLTSVRLSNIAIILYTYFTIIPMIVKHLLDD